MNFTIQNQDKGSGARTGILVLPHGPVETPSFMPVGTAGAVKGAFHRDVRELGFRLILGNTYHLFLRPGVEIIEKAGGLHAFTGWEENLLTDSGGFQIFSLSEFRRITDEGVRFRSHIDGSYHTLTPESVVDIQRRFGSDIQMVLDVCTGYEAPVAEVESALSTTTRWASRAKRAWDSARASGYEGAAFGIVQGHFNESLRRRSVEEVCELDFPGYAIGGLSVGEPHELFRSTLEFTAPLLPLDRPRYVMGIGTPEYILDAIGAGIDMFDCVLPTRIARNGTIFTVNGRVALKNEQFKHDFSPLCSEWSPDSLSRYSRAYVRHMMMNREMIGPMIATLHNINFLGRLVEEARRAISENRFSTFKKQFLSRYLGGERSE